MSDLMRDIEIARCEFECSASAKPTKLYLGRNQFLELRALAWEACSYRMMPGVMGVQRNEYCGMKIYEVDDQDYVGVGL